MPTTALTDDQARRAALTFEPDFVTPHSFPMVDFITCGAIANVETLIRTLVRSGAGPDNDEAVALLAYITRAGARGPVVDWPADYDR